MNLQLKGQCMRLRLSEADLAQLLAEGCCTDTTWLAPDSCWQRSVRLVHAPASFRRDGDTWAFALPRQAFEAFANERPRRDGYCAIFHADGDHPIELSVEVDVRDSRKLAAHNAARATPVQSV